MSLERRLSELERMHGGSENPHIIFYVSGDEPPPSEEEEQALIRETIERNPGQSMYTITWPPRERGEDAS